MQARFKTLFVGALLAVSAATVIAAPPASDPAIGTWKLNLEKSKFSPGPGPKSQIRTYVETPQGITLTIKTTGGRQGNDRDTDFQGRRQALRSYRQP